MQVSKDRGKARLQEEFDRLTSEVVSRLPDSEKEHFSVWHHVEGHTLEMDKLHLLDHLIGDRYWNFSELHKNLKGRLPDGELRFYASVAIEQAQHDFEKGKGYLWLIEAYDKGPLRDYLDDNLKREATNQAFWHLVGMYFVGTNGLMPSVYHYNTVMKYADDIDLTRCDEFQTKPLRERRDFRRYTYLTRNDKNVFSDLEIHGWPDNGYIKLFERYENGLTTEQAGRLAAPMLDSAIYNVLDDGDEGARREEARKEGYEDLERYKKYLATKEGKNLLEGHFAAQLHYRRIKNLELLSTWLGLSGDSLKEHTTGLLSDKEHYYEKDKVAYSLGPAWLTDEAMLIQNARLKVEFYRIPEKLDNFNEAIWHIIDAIGRGFLDREFATEAIAGRIRQYIGSKRRPSGKTARVVAHIIKDDNCKALIDRDLYKEAMNRALADLVIRKRFIDATEIYKLLDKEGVLDKEKIPEFKLIEEKAHEAKGQMTPQRSKTKPHSHRWAFAVPKPRKIYRIPEDPKNMTMDSFLRLNDQE